MEISSAAYSWISELEMEDTTHFMSCRYQIDSFNDDPLFDQFDFQSLSSGSYSSNPDTSSPENTPAAFNHPTMGSAPLISSSVHEMPAANLLKPDNGNKYKIMSSSSSSSSSSKIISFGYSGSVPNLSEPYGDLELKKEIGFEGSISFPALMSSSCNNSNYSSKAAKGVKRTSESSPRDSSQAQEHVLAERKRRERLSECFVSLSDLIPGLKKLDKASVLGDAIKYIKQLQEREKTLQDKTSKQQLESVVHVKKSRVTYDDESSSSDESSELQPSSKQSQPEIEARVSDKNVLIRVHCENRKGAVMDILNEIEKLHLSVTTSSALPFGHHAIDIAVVAKMVDGYCMTTVQELVRNLGQSLSKFV